MNLNKLTPIQLRNLLYDVVEKIQKLQYIYDEEKNITYNDYFLSEHTWYYDARKVIEEREKYKSNRNN